MRHRQEVLNVLLAQHLRQEGLIAEPEVLARGAGGERMMPDVMVRFRGLRLAIEGEFGDGTDMEAALIAQVAERVESGLAHIAAGVLYPASLREESREETPEALAGCDLRFALVTEAQRPETFTEGSVHDLANALRRLHEGLGREEVLDEAVAILQAGIEQFVVELGPQQAVVDRFAGALGIRAVNDSEALTAAQQLAVRRIGGLILTNALIFHEVLTWTDSRLPTLAQASAESDVAERLTRSWTLILTDINYYPIFHVALDLLRAVAQHADVSAALSGLIRAATRILTRRGAIRHDLMGRIYHRLLAEAKHLGAYYTSIPAATTLLKLALRPQGWPGARWEDLEALEGFRAADLACGSGTLLMATAEAITDNYVHGCYQRGIRPDLTRLHSVLLEHVLWGYDVLPSALHLTASTLSIRSPDVAVQKLNLYSVRLGGPRERLGSLEFITGQSVNGDPSLFSYVPDATRETGMGPEASNVTMPQVELCVMNPPFTRSVGGNLLFGNLPADERARLQERLGELIRTHELEANTTAGLGSPFVATAHPQVDVGGRLALVLPRAVLSGVAWAPTRRLIERHYHLEYVVVSHEPGRWNFSENTDLSETMLVARRRFGNDEARNCAEGERSERTVFINLWHNSRNVLEGLTVAAQTCEQETTPELRPGVIAQELQCGNIMQGEAFAVAWEEVAGDVWFFWAAFAQSELVAAFNLLRRGELLVPRATETVAVPLRPLGDLGRIGPDRRDIHDGFRLARRRTHYPAFWNHTTSRVTCMSQGTNAYLAVLAEPHPGRPRRRPELLWPLAARLLIAERMRTNTMRVGAVLLDREALSNVWWPVSLCEEANKPGMAEALALWYNSTPGVLMLLGHRTETTGPWCQIKKPILGAMPVLDVTALTEAQLAGLAEAYEALKDRSLLRLPEMAEDPVRAAIDRAIQEALDLPDLNLLRESLSWEPVVCLTNNRLLANNEDGGAPAR